MKVIKDFRGKVIRKMIFIWHTFPPLFRTQHPDTQIGEPGPLQGVNTGVVLLHLERMRRSAQLAAYTEDGAMTRLCHKYSFKGFIGDQVRFISDTFIYIPSLGLVEYCSVGQAWPNSLSRLRLQLPIHGRIQSASFWQGKLVYKFWEKLAGYFLLAVSCVPSVQQHNKGQTRSQPGDNRAVISRGFALAGKIND